jgi:hypothetical protein
MARTSSSTSKERLNKGQITKIAEESARKAVRKTAGKVARAEATKVAHKVATEAALNPDYELNEEDELPTSFLSSWDADEEEEDEDEEEEEDSKPPRSFASFVSNDDDDDNDTDLSQNVKNRDIFAFANKEMNKGIPVRLQIKKNGQFLTTVKKPYSEEQLQKEHGEGHYSVILRNDVKGTFIKQQSFSIAAPPAQAAEVVQLHAAKQEEKIDKMFQTFSQMQSSQSDSQNQLFERLMEEQRRREDEEKERRREERELMKYNEQNNNSVLSSVLQAALAPRESSDGGSMSSILQVMQSQQSQTTQMIMEMNKNNMMMIQEMRRDTQNMMEKISQMSSEQAREFRHQIAEMGGKKQEGFDAVAMFKMLNDTREAGMNFGLKINDLAKQIAESDIQPTQPKSIVESVLDNLGKFAPLMLAAGQQSSAATHFQPQVQSAPPALVAAPPAPSYRQQAAPKPAQKPVQKTAANPIQSKTAAQKPVILGKTVTKGSVKKTTTETVVASNSEGGKISADADLKTKVIEICVPLIGHALQNNINSGGLGEASINAFNSQGIETKKAVELVSVEDIYNLAFSTYSLPDMPEIRHYLKDYHDYLCQKASFEQSGQIA